MSPLMVNRFAEKSKTEMKEKHQKTAKRAKVARDPIQEMKSALYFFPDGKKTGMPANGIKNAMVTACKFIDGLPATKARGAFFVKEQKNGLVEIKGKYVLDERIVRIGPFGRKVAMMRYRPRYDEWSATFELLYNERMISPSQLLNLLENAGFAVGLCESRPEKNGNLGMFKVKR